MAGARGCFNCGGCAWCFCVVAVVVSPSCALCADACTYSSPLFFSPLLCRRLWCGADGDRDFLFFFYNLLYIDRAQSKLLSKIHIVCIVQLDTRLQTVQRRAHLLGKQISFCSDQMTSRESLTRAFLPCDSPLISYNCKSACVFSSHSIRSRVGLRDC